MIRSGRADVVIAGGCEAAIHPLNIAAFAAMRALSTRNDDPQGASRPFDVNRDGFVMGEGAATLILESAEHAAARGARVYAVAAGAGYTCDAYDIVQPDPVGAGASRAISAAIADAGLSPSDIAHINAHATSTPAGDVPETVAIRSALGDSAADAVAVTSTKSMTGHLLGGAGALESVATVLALYHGVVPATINVEEIDPGVVVDVVVDKPRGAAVFRGGCAEQLFRFRRTQHRLGVPPSLTGAGRARHAVGALCCFLGLSAAPRGSGVWRGGRRPGLLVSCHVA